MDPGDPEFFFLDPHPGGWNCADPNSIILAEMSLILGTYIHDVIKNN
jgi:hypothetical protein